jgi:hypothetical protein
MKNSLTMSLIGREVHSSYPCWLGQGFFLKEPLGLSLEFFIRQNDMLVLGLRNILKN